MKKIVKFVSLLLIVASVFSTQFITFASAATTTKKYDCKRTVTMTVKTTNKNANMKLQCNAATYSEKFGIKTYKHTCKVAPKMVITVSPQVNGKSVYYLQGLGTSISSTLKFDKVGTYTVTISYLYNKCNQCPVDCKNAEWYHNYVGNSVGYCGGTWYVKSAKNLNISSIRVK